MGLRERGYISGKLLYGERQNTRTQGVGDHQLRRGFGSLQLEFGILDGLEVFSRLKGEGLTPMSGVSEQFVHAMLMVIGRVLAQQNPSR